MRSIMASPMRSAICSRASSQGRIAYPPQAQRGDRYAQPVDAEVRVGLVRGLLDQPAGILPSTTSLFTCVARIFTNANARAANRPFEATRKSEDEH
jgi:hypothetical protein